MKTLNNMIIIASAILFAVTTITLMIYVGGTLQSSVSEIFKPLIEALKSAQGAL